MIDWNDLTIFLAVYRKGQLTAAGRTLGADQSTVGRRIAALEAQLSSKLFFRLRDGLRPTPAADRLYPRAVRMEEEAFAIGRENEGEEERLSGHLRVTTPDGFGALVVAPLLSKFSRLWPDIEVEMLADNRVFSLSRQEADLAIRVGTRPRESGIVARKLGDYGVGLYASRGYVEERGMPKPDYRGHDIIAYDIDSRSYSDARWLAENAKEAKVTIRANTNWAVLAAMQAGMGFSTLPTFLVKSQPDLVEVRPPIDTLAMQIWLILHKDLQQTAKVRTCADFLASELALMGPELRGEKKRARR